MSRRPRKPEFNKSKLVVLKAEDGRGSHEMTTSSPHFPSYLFTQENGKGEENMKSKVFLPVPSLFPPFSVVYYEHFSSPRSKLSDKLQFIHIGIDPDGGRVCYDLSRDVEEYRNVTTLEFSESLPTAMSVFQVVSQFESCTVVKIFLDARHVFWPDLEPPVNKEWDAQRSEKEFQFVCSSVTTLHIISEFPVYRGKTIPTRLKRLFYYFSNMFPNVDHLYAKMDGAVGEVYNLVSEFCSTKGVGIIGNHHSIKLNDGVLTCEPKKMDKEKRNTDPATSKKVPSSQQPPPRRQSPSSDPRRQKREHNGQKESTTSMEAFPPQQPPSQSQRKQSPPPTASPARQKRDHNGLKKIIPMEEEPLQSAYLQRSTSSATTEYDDYNDNTNVSDGFESFSDVDQKPDVNDLGKNDLELEEISDDENFPDYDDDRYNRW